MSIFDQKVSIIKICPFLIEEAVCIYKADLCYFQRLADREFGVHKLHANYGRVFSEWSGLEREMADGLQTAGHYMDVYVWYITRCMMQYI